MDRNELVSKAVCRANRIAPEHQERYPECAHAPDGRHEWQYQGHRLVCDHHTYRCRLCGIISAVDAANVRAFECAKQIPEAQSKPIAEQ